jgi:integrase
MTQDAFPVVPTDSDTATLALAGQAFNRAAAAGVFADYAERKAANTLRRQRADLCLFAGFLATVGILRTSDDLQAEAEAWRGLTWGLIEGFKRWMLQHSYAVRSVNVRLSTIKTYAGLAFKAGVIDHAEHAAIRLVSGYASQEALHVDENREQAGQATRIQRPGAKKAQAITIPPSVVLALKTADPDSPQGRRDALLMCLLLDHGLRCGEVARLTVADLDVQAGELRFFRPKVNKVQTHRLSADTQRAAEVYLAYDALLLAESPLLRESLKDGSLTAAGMSERAITKRVKALGSRSGLVGLSAHDCRHSWATRAARNGTDPFALQEAGGWNSLAMPRRYVEAARIANEGVKLE